MRGRLFVYFGPLSGALDSSSSGRSLHSTQAEQVAAYDLSSAGDMDADGLSDLLMGVPGPVGAVEGSGAALLLPGAAPS